MFVPQKCQYALRAIFEMALHQDAGNDKPVKIGDIAARQAIPSRFLESLLNTLKKGGFVVSYRGKNGGYALARHPRKITVLQVMEFMQGPLDPVNCDGPNAETNCPLRNKCVFEPMWEEAKEALRAVYAKRTFEDLVELEKARSLRMQGATDFSI